MHERAISVHRNKRSIINEMHLSLGIPASDPRRPVAIPIRDPRKSSWILRKLVSQINRLLRPLMGSRPFSDYDSSGTILAEDSSVDLGPLDREYQGVKEKLLFIVGTGAALLGIALVANGIEQVQFGPGWEVPAAAVQKWFWFGIISVLLYLVGIFSYALGNRLASQTPMNRVGFWFLLCVGAALTTLSFALDPGQWPISHQNLSAVARRSSIPVSIACGLLWVLLIARSRQQSSPQVPD